MVPRLDSSAVARLLAILALVATTCPANAREFECDTRNTTVVAADSRDAGLACEGTAAAIEFLEAQGLDVATDIRIEIRPLLDEDGNDDAAGYFFASDDKVVVLSYAEFRKFKRWLRVPVSDTLYRGLVAHEVAHLIAAHNFKISKPTIQAQEYIAYVTTLAVLEPRQRELVLSEFPGNGYETEQQMNTTIYLCDPMRFGVEAYRHFLKEGRRANYFGRILSGEVLAG
jgi:hypothetical protein